MNPGDIVIMTIRISEIQDLIGEVKEVRDYGSYREIVFHKPCFFGKEKEGNKIIMRPISEINSLIGEDIIVSSDKVMMYYPPKKERAEEYRAIRAGIVHPDHLLRMENLTPPSLSTRHAARFKPS